jgi:hypothetical protein
MAALVLLLLPRLLQVWQAGRSQLHTLVVV